jgi:hypothetical protein
MSSPVINGIAYDCLDVEGRLDWLDGWHEECGLNFKTERNPDAMRRHLTGRHQTTGVLLYDEIPARQLMNCGREERIQIRDARGV